MTKPAAPTSSAAAVPAEDALWNVNLHDEILRQRRINRQLGISTLVSSVAAVVCLGLAGFAFTVRPPAIRVAVDPAGRAYPIEVLSTDVPDAKVTARVNDCMNGVLNASFHNYQNTVNRAIDECFTGSGTVSIKSEIDPFLAQMKREQMNLASSFTILPFINSRESVSGHMIYKVQGVVQVGFRGTQTASRPVSYAFEASVVRVSFESSISGLRMENIRLKQQAFTS